MQEKYKQKPLAMYAKQELLHVITCIGAYYVDRHLLVI